jgi:hypothetical protein
MRLKHSERNEEDKLVRIIVGPEHLPQLENGIEWELALECDENPSGIRR